MARLFRIAIFIACILAGGRAFAAGGACPSGANYTNPANPTGALVTLASLGVTTCYYVAANGSDSNPGTSESSPWLHSPGMANFTGSFSGFAAGQGFIFRGGDTWHFGNSSLTASGTSAGYAGVVTNCAINGTVAGGLCLNDVNGTSSNPIYFGVDPGWPATGWTRPILTADNPLCNSGTANGTTCISTTDSYGQPSYYVSSCLYQVGGSNDLVDVGYSKYVIFDNFELTGLCQNSVGQPGGDTYVRYGGFNAPLTFQNLYIHGASHLKFAGLNGSAACTPSVVCTDTFAFRGGPTNPGSYWETVQYNVVDFADSDPGGQGLCYGGFSNVQYNVFRYTSQCINNLYIFHDNLYEYFFENGHSNVLESGSDLGVANAVYNNIFRHIETYVTSGGGIIYWPLPGPGKTTYTFNNLIYDIGNLEYFNIGGGGSGGTYTIFNNTFQTNFSQPILRCSAYTTGAVNDINNHYIDNQSYILGPCSTLTTTSALAMSNATATVDGYTGSQTYGYAPISAGSPTVGTGTNKNSTYCGALTSAGLTDAASACQNDTRYACIYNTSNHTVTCPARTAAVRPTSEAWNIGAYQFNGTQAIAPNPPSNLAATVQQ